MNIHSRRFVTDRPRMYTALRLGDVMQALTGCFDVHRQSHTYRPSGIGLLQSGGLAGKYMYPVEIAAPHKNVMYSYGTAVTLTEVDLMASIKIVLQFVFTILRMLICFIDK